MSALAEGPGTAGGRLLRAALPAALALAGLVLLLDLLAFAFGQGPWATLTPAFAGTWGTPYGIGQVLFKATPLIFTGLAFDVGLRAGLFNIGAEGQLALGSLAAGWVAASLPAATPAVVAVPVALAVAAATGALVALAPAVMRARFGVHEIISTIMLNRIVDVFVPLALVAIGANSLRTADAVPGARLAALGGLLATPGPAGGGSSGGLLRALEGSAASLAFPLAVAVAFAADAWLRRSRAGRELGWVGQNPDACRAEGVDVRRRVMQAMLLSGALAGGVAAATVLGYKGYYELGLGSGAGFAGIAVALLGRGHPVGLVLAAVLFGTLDQAGLAINAHVPREAMSVLEACVILLVAVAGAAVAPRRSQA